jgi:hypothetical protein
LAWELLWLELLFKLPWLHIAHVVVLHNAVLNAVLIVVMRAAAVALVIHSVMELPRTVMIIVVKYIGVRRMAAVTSVITWAATINALPLETVVQMFVQTFYARWNVLVKTILVVRNVATWAAE